MTLLCAYVGKQGGETSLITSSEANLLEAVQVLLAAGVDKEAMGQVGGARGHRDAWCIMVHETAYDDAWRMAILDLWPCTLVGSPS